MVWSPGISKSLLLPLELVALCELFLDFARNLAAWGLVMACMSSPLPRPRSTKYAFMVGVAQCSKTKKLGNQRAGAGRLTPSISLLNAFRSVLDLAACAVSIVFL